MESSMNVPPTRFQRAKLVATGSVRDWSAGICLAGGFVTIVEGTGDMNRHVWVVCWWESCRLAEYLEEAGRCQSKSMQMLMQNQTQMQTQTQKWRLASWLSLRSVVHQPTGRALP